MAPTTPDDLIGLKTTKTTTLTLLSHLLAPSSPPQTQSTTQNLDALSLAHDTTSLIRAHTTKLSLLIINAPFTPSAITRILRELVAGPLPGLASAVEICTAENYGKAMNAEMKWRVQRVFGELVELVKVVPEDGKALGAEGRDGGKGNGGKGSLAVTAQVWAACDAVAALKTMGVAGLAVKKVEEWRAMLKDALEEMQEWGEEESDGEDEEDEVGGGEEDEKQRELDEMFGGERHIPVDDPEKIRPRLESCLKRLRLLITMYQAVVKRRLKTLPQIPVAEQPERQEEGPMEKPSRDEAKEDIKSKNKQETKEGPADEVTAKVAEMNLQEKHDLTNGTPKMVAKAPGIVTRLDEVLSVLKKLPESTDELASAFYELDVKGIDKMMDECFFAGFGAAELLMTDWKGQKDEFSTWGLKFQDAMKKGW